MGLIIGCLLIVGLIICTCVMVHVDRKVRKSADELCRRASNLITDIGAMEADLIELKHQIRELSNVLYESEDDLK